MRPTTHDQRKAWCAVSSAPAAMCGLVSERATPAGGEKQSWHAHKWRPMADVVADGRCCGRWP
eukprot:5174995-Prymnesium_polylepis.1